ncbi:MAG: hypothetical protein Q8J97_09110, partial [Flavobacteriaceae bacterium]|nr:hypothetical protein [Flavobacteriaceae bacterium]
MQTSPASASNTQQQTQNTDNRSNNSSQTQAPVEMQPQQRNPQHDAIAKAAVVTGAKAALFGGLTTAAGLFSGKSLKESLQSGANVGLDTGIAGAAQHSAVAGQALQSNAFNALRSGDLKGAVSATQQGVQQAAQNQETRAALVGAAA